MPILNGSIIDISMMKSVFCELLHFHHKLFSFQIIATIQLSGMAWSKPGVE